MIRSKFNLYSLCLLLLFIINLNWPHTDKFRQRDSSFYKIATIWPLKLKAFAMRLKRTKITSISAYYVGVNGMQVIRINQQMRGSIL